MKEKVPEAGILSIDIGGSHIKAVVLNAKGELQVEYKKLDTPVPANPENVVKTIQTLVTGFPAYSKISVGFPGYVKNGVVMTAPNLGTDTWHGTDLAKKLQTTLGKPAHVVNDADMQGLGVV